jgi:hypothetical protein
MTTAGGATGIPAPTPLAAPLGTGGNAAGVPAPLFIGTGIVTGGAGIAAPLHPFVGPQAPPLGPVHRSPTQGKIFAVGSHFHGAL